MAYNQHKSLAAAFRALASTLSTADEGAAEFLVAGPLSALFDEAERLGWDVDGDARAQAYFLKATPEEVLDYAAEYLEAQAANGAF